MLPPREVEARYLCCLQVRLKHLLYVAGLNWGAIHEHSKVLPPPTAGSAAVYHEAEFVNV